MSQILLKGNKSSHKRQKKHEFTVMKGNNSEVFCNSNVIFISLHNKLLVIFQLRQQMQESKLISIYI